MRSSPGNSVSRPPLKKNVTCAYFSVSAMRSCFRPASATVRRRCRSDPRGGNSVARKRLSSSEYSASPSAAAKRDAPVAREAGEIRVEQGAGDLAHAVGAEIGEEHAVAVLHAAIVAERGRQHELVALAARIGGLDRGDRIGGVLALGRRSARDRPSRPGPSACRGPSRNSARRPWRCGRRRGRRYRPRTAGDSRSRDLGGVSRPSRKAWTATGSPASARIAASAAMWCWCEWTPPGDRRPMHMRRAAARLQLGDEILERRHARRACRRRSPRRCAADPASRRGRRRYWCGRPRNCPSARRAGRHNARWPGAGHAASAAISSCQIGVLARSIALSARSARSPQPSRMHSTTGRGREFIGERASIMLQRAGVRPYTESGPAQIGQFGCGLALPLAWRDEPWCTI